MGYTKDFPLGRQSQYWLCFHSLLFFIASQPSKNSHKSPELHGQGKREHPTRCTFTKAQRLGP